LYFGSFIAAKKNITNNKRKCMISSTMIYINVAGTTWLQKTVLYKIGRGQYIVVGYENCE